MFKESKLGTLSALEQDTFLRIMMRESSMQPDVKPGDQGKIYKHRTGKMLINKKTGREYPEIKYIVSKTEKAPKKKWAYLMIAEGKKINVISVFYSKGEAMSWMSN